MVSICYKKGNQHQLQTVFLCLFLLIRFCHTYGMLDQDISDAKLALLNKNNVHCINSNANFHCDICPLAKQKRLPFNISTTISNECFDLLHCDIWGPFFVPTIHGCRFFLIIVDDCSRCTWVYLLKHKSQTASQLDQFCTMVETQFARKVKCIRLDNGTEFFLKYFFTKRGILHQLSCVETPQQNAVVERNINTS